MVSRKSALGCTKTIPKTIQKPSKTDSRLFQLKESLLFFMTFLLFSCLLKFILCRLSLQAGRTSKTYGHRYGPMEIQLRQQSNWISPIPVSASSCFLDFFFVFGMDPKHSDRGETAVWFREICWTLLDLLDWSCISCLCARGGPYYFFIVTLSAVEQLPEVCRARKSQNITIPFTENPDPNHPKPPPRLQAACANLDPEHVQKQKKLHPMS